MKEGRRGRESGNVGALGGNVRERFWNSSEEDLRYRQEAGGTGSDWLTGASLRLG